MNNTTQTISYADFYIKFVAALIDVIILDTSLETIFIIFNEVDINATLLNVIKIMIGWVYYAALDSLPKQVSIGKHIVELTLTKLVSRSHSFCKIWRYLSILLLKALGKVISDKRTPFGFRQSVNI